MIATTVSTLMFWPMLAMATLTAVAWGEMGRRRFAAIRQGEVPLSDFRGHKDPGLPAAAAVGTRHFANHFEVPVLFHVVCLLHIVFAVGGWLPAALAWAFVVLRAFHSMEHLGRNNVMVRFRFYAAGTLIVWVLWLELAVRLLVR